FMKKIFEKFAVDISFVDPEDLDQIEKAFKPNTKVLWFETPTNPLQKVVDIEGLAKLRNRINSNVVIVFDNTLLTPVFQNPIQLGADVVTHSLTKYVNGIFFMFNN